LYLQGKALDSISLPSVMVGMLTPSEYGILIAEKLCLILASAGFSIVNGLVRGINTLAHKVLLPVEADTITVFGCGLGHTYPPENIKLRE
jgi:DNA processing protein